jgi:ketose-bisphosphate aldolase
MALETMTEMLRLAKENHYAVGAFNIVDYPSMRAVVQAAQELSAPVIVQISVKTVRYWGHSTVISWLHELAKDSPVPVAIHLDHCKDLEFIQQCLDAGWTSVMFDGSSMPFEENLKLTRQVLAMAQAAGASVEAELGAIVGVEEDIIVDESQSHLADPDEAVEFCQGLPLAVFAPAIGTAHGVYKGKPNIAYDRIENISNRTELPLALHGGTGLTDDVLKRCIALGCAKVNISTQIKHTFIDSFVHYHQTHQEYEPLKPLAAQFEQMKKEISEKIIMFGGQRRAV